MDDANILTSLEPNQKEREENRTFMKRIMEQGAPRTRRRKKCNCKAQHNPFCGIVFSKNVFDISFGSANGIDQEIAKKSPDSIEPNILQPSKIHNQPNAEKIKTIFSSKNASLLTPVSTQESVDKKCTLVRHLLHPYLT